MKGPLSPEVHGDEQNASRFVALLGYTEQDRNDAHSLGRHPPPAGRAACAVRPATRSTDCLKRRSLMATTPAELPEAGLGAGVSARRPDPLARPYSRTRS